MFDATEQFLNGVMFGCLYALIGGGFTIIFGVMRRFNLAYGSNIMAGAYLSLVPLYLFRSRTPSGRCSGPRRTSRAIDRLTV